MKSNIVVTVILIAAALAGGFFAGMKYQQNKQPTFQTFFNGRGGQGGFPMMRGNGQFQGAGGGRGMRGGQVVGEIINQDEASITVKLQDGSTKIILFSDKTGINKAEAGSTSDLKTGERVAVFGTENSDGSVTAQNIQLNPVFRMMNVTPAPTNAK